MPTRKLTDMFVERAKPPARGRVEYFDAAFPGLALRITENGGKSWCVFYRFKGRLRRFTIGRYPAIKPAQARSEAAAALERVRQGVDPADEKRARRDMHTPDTDTFGAVAHDYLERYVRQNNRESTFLGVAVRSRASAAGKCSI
jgi:Arm DNA-binding domain